MSKIYTLVFITFLLSYCLNGKQLTQHIRHLPSFFCLLNFYAIMSQSLFTVCCNNLLNTIKTLLKMPSRPVFNNFGYIGFQLRNNRAVQTRAPNPGSLS
uniref:Uncharacterized protein n=1 Tax=Anguilla anguilla TaxID=7936 RepID=A0A0E9WPW2_ANGAN